MVHPSTATIVFLSDYGWTDPFVGLCHAVMASVAPQAHVVDLTHAIRPQDVSAGASVLLDSMPWLPDGAVVLGVVDPGVGTSRRGVIIAAGGGRSGRLLVGPDNGLLYPAAAALGGAQAAWVLPGAAGGGSTFDGRDVFAPAAGRLALGEPPDSVGERMDPSTLTSLTLPAAGVRGGRVRTEVVHVDGFGNLQLSAGVGLLDDVGLAPGAPALVQVGAAARPATVCTAFAQVAPGQIGILPDAFARLQIAVNRGTAARLLGAAVGDAVQIGPPEPGARYR